jgi:hypothetical protein
MNAFTQDAGVPAQKELAKTNTDDKFVRRKLATKDKTEYEFKFLVIDSAEKWEIASTIFSDYDMPLLGKGQVLRFTLKGVSLADWERVEIEHRIPKWDDNQGVETEDHKQLVELALSCKRAQVIEVSSGKKIPGEDYAAKSKALQSLNPGEVLALYYHIQNIVCSMDNGNLFGQYQRVAAEASANFKDRVVTFDSFDVWQKATETPYIFRMQRPTEDYILEFPLKNISAEAKLAIDSETREPEAPKVPARDPQSRKFIPNQLVPDYNDVGWLSRVRAIHQKRTVMFFSACLPFDIPGQNEKEKYEWLSQRLVGDVVRLRNFIEEELCEYHSRYNFLSNV